MCVVPEKPDNRSDHCAAEYGQFSDLWHLLQFQGLGKARVSAHVSKNRQSGGGYDSAAYRQSIQSIRQIDRVARANDHQNNKKDERQKSDDPKVRGVQQRFNGKVRSKPFYERHHQVRGILTGRLHCNQYNRNYEADRDLEAKFGTSSKSQVAMMDDLQIIVCKSNRCECQGRKHDHPDVTVREVRPKQRWDDDCDHNQHSSHCRSASFFLMGRRALFPDVLSDLELAQLANDCWTYDHAHEERSKTGKCGTEGDVTEDAKRRKEGVPLLIQQPIKQSSSALADRTFLNNLVFGANA